MRLLGFINILLTSRSSITIFDYTTQQPSIQIPQKKLGQPNRRDDLKFSIWNLAHATLKADLIMNGNISLIRRFAFLLDIAEFVDYGTSRFKFRKQGINLLGDFVKTSYTGRIAQGMAVLFMEKMKYTYIGKPKIIGNHKCADFLFQGAGPGYALVESKGSYAARPPLKKMLTVALGQINRTIPLLPVNLISKSFAIACIFGDNSNSRQTSLNFIDPEDKGGSQEEFEEDYVLRSNYSSWLSGMGYTELAEIISPMATYKDENKPIEIRTAVYNGKKYIINFFRNTSVTGGELEKIVLNYFNFNLLPFGIVMGLEMRVLEGVIKNIKEDNKVMPKMEVRRGAIHEILSEGPVSVFSDGTIYGFRKVFTKTDKEFI
ncbi:hypothetical protein Acife_1947 [Acidithiobacillus ferrivorans SS3]|uniref:Uncharacterized protein n=1 Tax=Acidithiobacillus ferrivorans SS3 TaxID=743299 RepID=G0JLM1_9PROT|nr:hypothetical protein [Acidithiobacillus ferrivorans]AEM48070.1 hypothetical protein Acife_1947 [Acidithiobacillus ferrivorans SS3]